MDAARLIKKYRGKGVLVDTNLLLLYVVGQYDTSRITQFKRTSQFSVDDYHLLCRVIGGFATRAATPNVLTEVSNLAAQLGEPARHNCLRQFSTQIPMLDERYIESRDAATHDRFAEIGLTDAALWLAASTGLLVVTDDFRLYGLLTSQGIDAINFNHIRTYYWS